MVDLTQQKMTRQIKDIHVLDTTLRDGNYVIDFNFTADDVEKIVRGLDCSGLPLIEVGHGLGINASSVCSPAAETDIAYIEAARKGVQKAKIAMFCIPGIAKLQDLKACLKAGLDVVRIGVDIDNYSHAEKYVEEARKHGVEVFVNLMKVYTEPPSGLLEISKNIQAYGASVLYLADSAGCMLPQEVEKYVNSVRTGCSIPVGFHAHNNLGLGMANALAAVDAGATYIDTTLMGMGRSSGNPPTETFVALMQRNFNACKDIDLISVMEMADRIATPVLRLVGPEGAIVSAMGLGKIHSSYLPQLRKASRDQGKSIYSVILAAGMKNTPNLDEDDIKQATLDAIPEQNFEHILGTLDLEPSFVAARRSNVSQRKVLILGGGRYYLRGIQAACDAGYHVVVADRDENAPAKDVATTFETVDYSDSSAILKLARKHGINGIVPLNDYGVVTAAYVAQSLALPGLSPTVASRSSNKENMRNIWVKHGVPCPRFEVVKDKRDFVSAVQRIGYPCIFKPAHGIGGASRGVIVVNGPEDLKKAIQFTLSFYNDPTTLVEEFVQATSEHSAELLIQNGQAHILAIGDKVKSDMPYRVDRNVLYPTKLHGKQLASVEKALQEAVKAIGINMGAVHVEIACTKEGVVLFELGARCGGGGTPDPIVPYVTGINYFLKTIECHLGVNIDSLQATEDRGCNYHFLFPKPGIVKSINGFDEVVALPGILDAGLFVGPGDTIPPVRTGLDRSGFIIATGKTQGEALSLGMYAESLLSYVYEM
ncbi:MAG: hypothetical protein COB46_01190 [Rhodospirillaceae bacterium]|nr:MAG: hypothetical protein COB46_01190 [Rhodospirillaceae bacterium]